MKISHCWKLLVIISFCSCMPSNDHNSTKSPTSNSNLNQVITNNNTTTTTTATPLSTTPPSNFVINENIGDQIQNTSEIINDLTKLKKKTGNGGNRVIAYPQGYISSGCENYSNYNFCLSIFDKNMNLIREITNGPKIPNNAYQTDFTAIMDIAYVSTGHIIIVGFTSQPLGEMPGV